jgi:hypothetical protein
MLLCEMYRNYESPFGAKAAAAGYMWNGGKEDDITVILAQVIDGLLPPAI